MRCPILTVHECRKHRAFFIYYLYDHLGNTRITYSVEVKAANDMDYTVQSATDYYPYGKALRTYGKERYQSTYHERDVESGFDYRGARFYDGDVVRFNSLDPLAAEFPAWSDYNYVVGNPIVFIDPSGKSAEQANCCGQGTTPTVAGIFFEAFQGARAAVYNTQQRFTESVKGYLGYEVNTVSRMRVNYNYDGSITYGNPVRVVQEQKKGFVAEVADTAMDGLALTPLVELGAARSIGAGAGPFLAAKTPSSIIPSVARQFDNFQCVDCADAIIGALKAEGISGEIVTIQAKGKMDTKAGNVWSDTAGKTISTNGHHRGVLVDGKVYDNIHTEGIDYNAWKNDFHSIEGVEIK